MLNRPWWVRVTWRCCATALLAAGALTTTASALDIPAFDSASLRMAITSASPGDTITFLGDITLDADLPAVQTSITIDGAGHTLSGKFMGTVLFRGFFIGAWEEGTATQVPVTVTIQNLTIQDTKAAGGNGGGIGPAPGGGGGSGFGRSDHRRQPRLAGVTLSNVTLISNTAAGGGGGGPGNGTTPGGGGGMGGHGGGIGGSALTGTPTTAGPYAFTVIATDAAGAIGVLGYSGAVTLPPAVPTLPWWALLLLSYLLFHLGVFRLRNRPT